MEVFLVYCLFAVTTSIASLYEILLPVLNKRLELKGHVENKLLYYIVVFLVHTLFAPLVFLSCIIPEWSIRFREAMYEGLFEQQDEND